MQARSEAASRRSLCAGQEGRGVAIACMYDEERWPTAGLATASAELSAGVGRSPFAQQPPATPPSKSSNAAAGGAIGRRPRERAPRREASSPMPFGTPLTNAASTKGARARKERPPCREGLRGLLRAISGVTPECAVLAGVLRFYIHDVRKHTWLKSTQHANLPDGQ